jgi:hypothetical protein
LRAGGRRRRGTGGGAGLAGGGTHAGWKPAWAGRADGATNAGGSPETGVVTVRASVPVPVPAALVADSWTLKVPAPAGVPEITPVEELTDSPGGRPVAPKVTGLFVALI